MSEYVYDLVVMGSGPAGQRAAVQAAKLGKRVLLAEKQTVVGGVCQWIGASGFCTGAGRESVASLPFHVTSPPSIRTLLAMQAFALVLISQV